MKKTLLTDIEDYIGIAKKFVVVYYTEEASEMGEMLLFWDSVFYIKDFFSGDKQMSEGHIKAEIYEFLYNCCYIENGEQINVKPNRALVAEVHDALAAFCSDSWDSVIF